MKLFFTLFSQGVKQEGDENAYERTSDTYRDLVTLLKSRSPHFAENINKEVQWNTGRCTFLAYFFVALNYSSQSRDVGVLKCLFVH